MIGHVRPRSWIALVGSVVAATVATAIFASGGAIGSTVSAASFSGAAGTVSVGGTLYAKQGGAVTLTVTTSSHTKCVARTGDHTAKSTWTFSFTAGSGDGVQTVTAAASPNVNPQGNCTGQSQNPRNASYVL